MRVTQWIIGVAMCLYVSTGGLSGGEAYARTRPPVENLIQAKGLILQVKARVTLLIQKIAFGGGGGDGGEDSCHRFESRRKCVTAGCFWDGNACFSSADHPYDGTYPDGSEGLIDEGRTNVLENDVAANFALQGMGSGLDHLALDIDQAAATYTQPEFWLHWGHACGGASGLLAANQAAKVAANIPPPGFVSAADFIPIDVELTQVKALLMCP